MNRWLRLFLVVFFLLVFVIGATAAYITIRGKRQIDAVNEVAQKLGFDPQDSLVQTRRCWDIFAHCGVFIYFDTDVSLDEMQKRTRQLGFAQQRFDRVDGYSIFTDVNIGAGGELTVDGDDGLESRDTLPEPDAHRWHLVDRQDREWVVGFYDLSETGTEYAFDGEAIRSRVVTVMLRTR
jgi:hypothetical protein